MVTIYRRANYISSLIVLTGANCSEILKKGKKTTKDKKNYKKKIIGHQLFIV